MNSILNFKYKNQLYVIFKNEEKIYIGQYKKYKLQPIDDKTKKNIDELTQIILSSDLNYDLSKKKKIKVIEREDFNVDEEISNAIELNVTTDNVEEFTAKLNEINDNYAFTFNFGPILIVLILFGGAIGGFYYLMQNEPEKPIEEKKTVVDNSEFLNKYTYTVEDSKLEFYNNVQLIEIKKKEPTNLLEGKILSFDNIYSYAIDTTNEDGVEVYTAVDAPKLNVSNSSDISTDLVSEYINELDDSEEFNVEDSLKRNNINNEIDLITAIIENKDTKVNSESSKEEIYDKYILDYYRENYTTDAFVVFTGDIKGYATMNDTIVNIYLENEGNLYQLSFIYDVETEKLTIEQITDFVSTINFVK